MKDLTTGSRALECVRPVQSRHKQWDDAKSEAIAVLRRESGPSFESNNLPIKL